MPVGEVPPDPDQRRQWLAHWAAEQRERLGIRDPLRVRFRRRIERALERQVERLDPVFDRRLNTARNDFLPKPGGGGIIRVAGPSPWHVLPRALRRVGATERDVFVEFGCGKGRVVHQAARQPLRKVIGVEIIPEVADFARGLIAENRHKYRCRSVEIVTSDAARFRIPSDLTIAYLADPFRGATLEAVLSNLIKLIDNGPRRLRLIYHRPMCAAEIIATGRFRLLPDSSFNRTAIFESCG
jgi:SAM-dependent methyltransferase